MEIRPNVVVTFCDLDGHSTIDSTLVLGFAQVQFSFINSQEGILCSTTDYFMYSRPGQWHTSYYPRDRVTRKGFFSGAWNNYRPFWSPHAAFFGSISSHPNTGSRVVSPTGIYSTGSLASPIMTRWRGKNDACPSLLHSTADGHLYPLHLDCLLGAGRPGDVQRIQDTSHLLKVNSLK